MTALDVDTSLDIDMTLPIPCVFEECEQPATWRETNRCPSKHGADMCAAHRERERGYIEANCADLCCATCRRPLRHPHVDWREL